MALSLELNRAPEDWIPLPCWQNEQFIVEATVEGLYTMMGRELVTTESVQAGNIFAIRGLEGKVWRSATLCARSGMSNGLDSAQTQECLINLGRVSRSVRLLF